MKKLFCALLCLCLALSLLPAQAFATERLSYVALGDSITTGYGLKNPDTESFASLLAEKGNFTLTNLAKDGETTETLLQTIQEGRTEIQNADIITITIGGNDLMNVLYNFLVTKYNSDSNNTDTVDTTKIKEILQSNDFSNLATKITLLSYITNNTDDLKIEISSAIDSVTNKFSQIIAKLKALNKNATIIVATQYNPYEYAAEHAFDVPLYNINIKEQALQISSLFNSILNNLNNFLKQNTLSLGYKCADVFAAFSEAVNKGENPCNATFASLQTIDFDFHPNAYGHRLIKNTMLDYALQYSISVTPATLVFDTTTVGYADSKAQTVTITNTGNQEVTVDLPTSNAYIITAKAGFSNGKATLSVNDQATFTVQPKAGLTAGTYKETITVKGTNDIRENITVTFTVEEKKVTPTQPNTENQAPQAGTILENTTTGDTYKVTESGKEVAYIESGSKSKKTEKVPETVTINGTKYTVTSIANSAFKNNKKLTKIVIGKNVTKIGKKAFYGCKNLKKITIKSTKLKKKNIGAKAFAKAGSKNYSKLKVIVPKKCLKSYKKLLKQKGLSSKATIKK